MLSFIASRRWRNILQSAGNANRLISSGGRSTCFPIQDLLAKCHPKNPDLLKCQKKRAKKREDKRRFPFKHLIYNPKCCEDECIDPMPRFDDLYYRPSNKNRLYTQTWKSCESPLYKIKCVNCYDNIRPIPYKKRKRGIRKEVLACSPKTIKGLMPCIKQHETCPRITMPCCPAPRNPPKCKFGEKEFGVECMKICTPYPSFSECGRDKIKSKPFKECKCLEPVNICRFYDMVRLGLIKLPKRFRLKTSN